MAVGTSLAADRAERQNVKGGTVLVRLSFLLRYLVLFLILIAAAKVSCFICWLWFCRLFLFTRFSC